MDQRDVDLLEKKIEGAIADVLEKIHPKILTSFPDDRTIHLMAKAAVTVYEASLVNEE